MQVFQHVVHEHASVGVELVRPHQHMEPGGRRLGAEPRAFDRVDRVEMAPDAHRPQLLLDVVARGGGEHELGPAKPGQGVAQGVLVDEHVAQFRELVRGAQELARVGAVVPHQSGKGGAVLLPEARAHRVGAFIVQRELLLQEIVDLHMHGREDVRPRVMQRVVEVEDPHPPRRGDAGDAHYPRITCSESGCRRPGRSGLRAGAHAARARR